MFLQRSSTDELSKNSINHHDLLHNITSRQQTQITEKVIGNSRQQSYPETHHPKAVDHVEWQKSL